MPQVDKKFHGHCASWVSQGALVVKNLPANAGDIRDIGYYITCYAVSLLKEEVDWEVALNKIWENDFL